MSRIAWLAAAVSFSSTPACAPTPDAPSSALTMSANALVAGAVPSTIQPAVSPEIQQYFDQNILYKDRIRHSFYMKQAVGEQDTVDCIQDSPQPPPPVPPSPPTTIPPSSLPPVSGLLSNTAQDGTMDSLGRIRACPAGTFAQVRPSISQLAPYGTVAAWQAAQAQVHRPPVGPAEQAPLSIQSPGYDHAAAGQYAANWGMWSDISFHNPALNYANKDPYPTGEHSVSQLWLFGHYHEPSQAPYSDQQSIEIGWTKIGNSSPVVMIFASLNNYTTFCFDADCANLQGLHWVLLNSQFTYGAPVPVAPAGGFPNHGSFGIYGSRTDGYWYVYIINQWVGYFWFDSGPLSRANVMAGTGPSNFLIVGGEVLEGRPLPPKTVPPGTIHPYIQMGTGNFPSVYSSDYNNFFNNAFSACNFYLDGTGTWKVGSPATSISRQIGCVWIGGVCVPQMALWAGVERPDCYKGQVIYNYQSPTSTPYLLFGGPGPNGSACTTY